MPGGGATGFRWPLALAAVVAGAALSGWASGDETIAAGSPAPVYFPADPGIALGDPGLSVPGAVVADGYAAGPCAPMGGGLMGGGLMGGGLFGGGLMGGGLAGGLAPAPGQARPFRLVGGFDLVFVEPFFESNEALLVTESDGVSFENTRALDFNYGLEFTPRLWIKGEWRNGGGIRLAWWQFDHSPGNVTAAAPANGFGRVAPGVTLGGVDISATAPGESLTARSSLNLYAIDLEGVKDARVENLRLVFSGGVRFAEVDQRFVARLTSGGVLAGEIDLRSNVSAFGPTAALLVERPLPMAVTLFTDARLALLYGDGTTTFQAGEDLNLAVPFSTQFRSSRDDLLLVAETRLGVLWGPQFFSNWYPFVGLALEGQFWDGAGSATSDEGNLGLFGFNVMLGASW